MTGDHFGFWPKADMQETNVNVGFQGKADIDCEGRDFCS
jgi:hypothetical protein